MVFDDGGCGGGGGEERGGLPGRGPGGEIAWAAQSGVQAVRGVCGCR